MSKTTQRRPLVTAATPTKPAIPRIVPRWVRDADWTGDPAKIRDIAYAIEANKRHFDMSTWLTMRNQPAVGYNLNQTVIALEREGPEAMQSCGTTGCIAGWALALNVKDARAKSGSMLDLHGASVAAAAITLLGATSNRWPWQELFSRTDYGWRRCIVILLFIADRIEGRI